MILLLIALAALAVALLLCLYDAPANPLWGMVVGLAWSFAFVFGLGWCAWLGLR